MKGFRFVIGGGGGIGLLTIGVSILGGAGASFFSTEGMKGFKLVIGGGGGIGLLTIGTFFF